MDQWNQRMMFPQTGMPPGIRQNASNQQNFYRPGNPQQFYPRSPQAQFHHGFHQNPVFFQHPNPIPSTYAPQHQPTNPMTSAELESIKKKRHFEEQQKRLMAMKQRKGQSATSQVDNPLKDLFGKKGDTGGMMSLLGSLGDTRSKANITSIVGQKGSSNIPVQIPAQATANYMTYSVSNEATPAAVNVSSSNWNNPGAANIDSTSTKLQSSGNTVHDDFGEFQQSSGMQFTASSTTEQPKVQRSAPSDVCGVKSADEPAQQHVSSGHMDNIGPVAVTTHQSKNRSDAAPATPSIEDLMNKSLTLDPQSQSSGKRFEKPKINKTIRAHHSHFTESTKASKFENLDSLSEMFTIPQSALVQSAERNMPARHVTADNTDDWSDFSTATGTVFQEQNPSIALATLSADSETFIWQGVNEGVYSTVAEPKGDMGLFSQPLQQSRNMFTPQVSHGSSQMVAAPSIPVTQETFGQGTVAEEFGSFQYETPKNDALPSAVQDQGLPGDRQELPSADPEQLIYGVTLPEWSTNTNMLPAVYKQIHKMCSTPSSDVISTSQLYPILLSSDLPRDKLGHIWSKCNKAVPGELNERELYLILGMVALAQAGLQVNKLTLEKLASCVTPPIPSFPEKIFPNEADAISEFPSTNIPSKSEQTNISPTEPDHSSETTPDNIFHATPAVDAVKNPDWSKWKTSKAAQVDDKFSDFQMLMPNEKSVSSTTSIGLPNINWSNSTVTTAPSSTFGSFESLTSTPSASGGAVLTNQAADTSKGTTDVLGVLAGAGDSRESKPVQGSAHVMAVPLQASQRYTLTGEDESIDHHEKAWLKCLTSCFTVVMKSCQTLQNITDANLRSEILSSQQGMSHYSAIIEIYCVSQRIKASVLKSAPNNKKIKETLQNIDNVWKTYLSFQPFKKLLPMENFNFSGCHINDGDDVNMSCGVCLLNVDKSCISSSYGSQRGKLSYGNRQYHTTCANFWCNKVDSVLPSLQFNFANSLI